MAEGNPMATIAPTPRLDRAAPKVIKPTMAQPARRPRLHRRHRRPGP